MNFRRRTFPEVLDNLLVAITKGVSAESHPFPPPKTTGPPYRHSLQKESVLEGVSVYGSRNGQAHLFRKDVDYKLLKDQKTLEWQEGAELPDSGTLLQINYYTKSSKPILTDIDTGSVVRTLSESIALEIARLYAQLEIVYQSGFVDTATGKALDNVVALLGIERVKGGVPAGEVEFTRLPGSSGAINIPAGMRVMTPGGEVEYETTESVTLAEAQNTVRVVARDLEINDILPADSLTVLPVPITGVASVTNPAPTAITTQNETDAELRIRAKNFLHGSERATLGAIKEAIKKQGVLADVEEIATTPGRIKITPHAETMPPEVQQRLIKAIRDVKPAGVFVDLEPAQAPKKVNLKLRITTTSGLLKQDLRSAQRSVRDKIKDYFAKLPIKEAGSINRIVGLVLSIPEVEDVRILSAALDTEENVLNLTDGQLDIDKFPTVLGELHIADPNLPTRLDVVISYPEDDDIPDSPAVTTALANMLTYLNRINASEQIEQVKSELSYGKLLRVIPLPDKPGESLETYDNAVASESNIPALPDESTISPYKVKFTFTLESGMSRILSQSSDKAYSLTPFERLSLGDEEVTVEVTDDQV